MKDRMELENVAFIGRTYEEYLSMFDLAEAVFFSGPVLDCPAGPSSFAAQACAKGFKAAACDVLYNLPSGELAAMGKRDLALIGQKLEETAHLFNWDYYGDKAGHMGHRTAALGRFLADFQEGAENGRYVYAELPRLPFADRSFRLVLSSHFLFLYGDILTPGFHAESLGEMARVSSGEVRIYPLQGLDARPYPHMDGVLEILRKSGVAAEIRPTPFEFFKGANKMLVLGRTGGPGGFPPAGRKSV
ncbi:MAG: hypothetical protein M0Z58_08280 [Nitrospiraceae bacterium]|nr:hypothetical protein [Nitrospiraceae bacterium]